jgi:hypothetical protein
MPDDLVVVCGSDKDNRFVVIDFAPTPPGTAFVNAPFSGGCLVDCFGTLAAVGNYQGDGVALYDISVPASPTLILVYGTGLTSGLTGLTGIGALSLDGTNLLVGESNGPNVVLIDVTNPASPSIVSTLRARGFTDGGISSLVLRRSHAVAAGPFSFEVLDYTTPSAPVEVPYVGTIRFESPVTCDFDGSTAAVGDGSGNVYVFQIPAGGIPVYVGQSGTGFFNGVTSVVVSGTLVAANFIGGGSVALLDFSNPSSPSLNKTIVGSNSGADPGGALKLGYGALSGALFFGTNNGSGVFWLDVSNLASPSVDLVAPNANLSPAVRPTLGYAAFGPGCVMQMIRFPLRLLTLLRRSFTSG